MVIGIEQAFTVMGIGVIGAIGSNVLAEIGKAKLAMFLDIIIYIGGMYVAFKVWQAGVDFIKMTFGVTF